MKSKYKNNTTFRKGHTGYKYWLGRKRDKKTKEKISLTLKGSDVAFKDGKFIRASGDKNSKWLGDSVGYSGIHRWLTTNFGQPAYCEYCREMDESKRFEWALIKGKNYERKRENFIRLCKRCHNELDGISIKEQHMKYLYG